MPSQDAIDKAHCHNLAVMEYSYKHSWLPNDIKHIVLGHGYGSSIEGSWSFNGDYEVYGVFNYINNNIPKGEKAIVMCCEAYGKVPNKNAIGTLVRGCGTQKEPAKIVISGNNKIIGEFYFNYPYYETAPIVNLY